MKLPRNGLEPGDYSIFPEKETRVDKAARLGVARPSAVEQTCPPDSSDGTQASSGTRLCGREGRVPPRCPASRHTGEGRERCLHLLLPLTSPQNNPFPSGCLLGSRTRQPITSGCCLEEPVLTEAGLGNGSLYTKVLIAAKHVFLPAEVDFPPGSMGWQNRAGDMFNLSEEPVDLCISSHRFFLEPT